MSRDDDRIADRLNEDIEGVISKFWPSWIRVREKGEDVALLTPRVKTGKKGASNKPTSSFKVELSGPHRGRWFRFSQGCGGYGIHLLAYGETGRIPNSKDEWREAFSLARQHLGIEERREESPETIAEREKRIADEKTKRDREAAQRKAEAEERAAERTLTAAEIWKGTIPLKGTHGEAYLVERGLPPIKEWPWNPDLDLRFHPALYYEKLGRFPCIIGRVADPFGVGSGVWRIFLDKKLPRKADVPNAKLGLGPASGGAVRLGGRGSRVGIAEGIESALAAWALLGFRYPVWAGLSTSGMQSFEPPMEIERISIIPDSDRAMIQNGKILDPPGITAARKLKARMDAAGVTCVINEMFALGDALDLLNTRRKYEQKAGDSSAPRQRSGREDCVGESVTI